MTRQYLKRDDHCKECHRVLSAKKSRKAGRCGVCYSNQDIQKNKGRKAQTTKELNRLKWHEQCPEGVFSTGAYRKKIGLCDRSTRRRLQELEKMGLIECLGVKHVIDEDGKQGGRTTFWRNE